MVEIVHRTAGEGRHHGAGIEVRATAPVLRRVREGRRAYPTARTPWGLGEPGRPGPGREPCSQPLPGSRETFGVVVGDSDQLDAIEALEGGIQAISVAALPVAPMTAAR